jgi:hypothetical protein
MSSNQEVKTEYLEFSTLNISWKLNDTINY